MSALWAVPLARDVVLASGPDTFTYLQGQLSQDVAGLPVGGSAHSLVLSPQGHLVALLRVTRTGDEEVALDTDPGAGDAMLARLQRFLLRTRCELQAVDWPCVAVRGDGAGTHDDVPDDELPSGVWAVVADTPGVQGYDLLGPGAAAPDGAAPGDPADYEALRIEQGVPRTGVELTEKTIPAEAGIVDRTSSFTKGCYTGQELVARIDSRGGNVPRRLRGVLVEGDVVPPPGATVVVDDAEVGHVTSAAASPRLGAPVALAYVKRKAEVPGPCTLRWDGGQAVARVTELPLS
ncbi:MAG: glycine cleavage T C-terminal barrel domain-containing protein [Acidimicrobiales bacterium]